MAVGLLADPGMTPAPPAPEATDTPGTGTIATQPQPAFTPPSQQPPAAAAVPPPPPPKPMSKLQSGVADILGDLADALAGKTRSVVYRDAQTGERVVDKQPVSRKQQWGQIIARAVSGAGAGAQVGTGPGGNLRALGAGIQTGEAQAKAQQAQQEALSDEDFKAKRDTMMQNANLALLGAKTTAASFDLAQAKVKALQGAVDSENTVNELIQNEGGEDLGIVRHPGDLVALTKNNPDLIKAHMNGGIYHALHFDEEGNYDGMRYYTIPADAGKQKISQDVQIRTLIPGKSVDDKPTVGFYTVPKGSKTVAEVAALSQAADEKISSTQLKQYNDEKTQQDKEARTKAENTESYAAANEHNANAQAARTTGAPDAADNDIASGLAEGRYLMGKDVPLRTTKGQTTAAQHAANANAYSMAHFGLPYSPEIVRQESHLAEEPKTQAYLSGVDRMLGTPGIPGQLDQVLALAQKAGVGENAPVQQVKLWVKQHLGQEAAKNFEQGLSDTQTALGTLIGNPLVGGGESDLKLKTAQKQFGSNPTMSDLRGAATTTREILERSRQELARNNRYIQQRYGDTYAPPSRAGNTQAPPRPQGVPEGSLFVKTTPQDPGQWLDPKKLDEAKRLAPQLQVIGQ